MADVTVVFTYGATVFTCTHAPAMGASPTIRKWMSPSIRSAGGNTFVYGKGIVQDILTLTWANMLPTDLANLLSFFTTVDGSANSFEFTDAAGEFYPVYFWGPSKLFWSPMELMERDISIELLVYGQYLMDDLGNRITDDLGNYIVIPNSI